MRKLAEVLLEDEMEDLQESLMDVLCKAKKSAKKRNTDNPPVNIPNLLSSPLVRIDIHKFCKPWHSILL